MPVDYQEGKFIRYITQLMMTYTLGVQRWSYVKGWETIGVQ